MTFPVEHSRDQKERVLAFADLGHEICSHSVMHSDMTKLSDEELERESAQSRAFLEQLTGAPIRNFATPFRAYDARVLSQLKQHYFAHRTVDTGFNARNNLNPYQLKSQNMLKHTTLEEFQSWVNKAIEENLWLILVYHKVDESNRSVRTYDTLTSDFAEQMKWLASTGVTVMRLDDALAETIPQTAIDYDPNVTPTTPPEYQPHTISRWWNAIRAKLSEWFSVSSECPLSTPPHTMSHKASGTCYHGAKRSLHPTTRL